MANTFRKGQRLCSKKSIETLFAGAGSNTASAYPLRIVYRQTEEAGIRILVSVSKRHFKHAVDRNRCKRQIREAYRLNQHILAQAPHGKGIDIAIIWTSKELQPSKLVHRKTATLLTKIAESTQQDHTQQNTPQP